MISQCKALVTCRREQKMDGLQRCHFDSDGNVLYLGFGGGLNGI